MKMEAEDFFVTLVSARLHGSISKNTYNVDNTIFA
jgi:hypothetical protein